MAKCRECRTNKRIWRKNCLNTYRITLKHWRKIRRAEKCLSQVYCNIRKNFFFAGKFDVCIGSKKVRFERFELLNGMCLMDLFGISLTLLKQTQITKVKRKLFTSFWNLINLVGFLFWSRNLILYNFNSIVY